MNIVLVGFMGSGKSSTARFISKNYGFRFLDTDRVVEKRTKMKIREIFEKYGENFFRKTEKDIISSNLAFCNNCVIATGGGFPCYFNNMDALKKIGWVFHLEISFEEIIRRVKNKTNRPLLDDTEKAKILYEKRIQYYRNAHFTIDATKDTKSIAEEIISKISS